MTKTRVSDVTESDFDTGNPLFYVDLLSAARWSPQGRFIFQTPMAAEMAKTMLEQVLSQTYAFQAERFLEVQDKLFGSQAEVSGDYNESGNLDDSEEGARVLAEMSERAGFSED